MYIFQINLTDSFPLTTHNPSERLNVSLSSSKIKFKIACPCYIFESYTKLLHHTFHANTRYFSCIAHTLSTFFAHIHYLHLLPGNIITVVLIPLIYFCTLLFIGLLSSLKNYRYPIHGLGGPFLLGIISR